MKLRYKIASGILAFVFLFFSTVAILISYTADCPAAAESASGPTMKAVVYRCYGGPEVLEYADIAMPVPAEDEVLVKVRATALNRADLLQRRGLYPAPPGVPQEIPGLDGVIGTRRWMDIVEKANRLVGRANLNNVVDAGRKLRQAGIKLSITVLLGIAGVQRSMVHAQETGRVISAIDPEYVGALSLMLIPGTPLCHDFEAGRFEILEPVEMLQELRTMIDHTHLSRGLFHANHASNYLPIRARLPRDREATLKLIDDALAGRRHRVVQLAHGPLTESPVPDALKIHGRWFRALVYGPAYRFPAAETVTICLR